MIDTNCTVCVAYAKAIASAKRNHIDVCKSYDKLVEVLRDSNKQLLLELKELGQ